MSMSPGYLLTPGRGLVTVTGGDQGTHLPGHTHTLDRVGATALMRHLLTNLTTFIKKAYKCPLS